MLRVKREHFNNPYRNIATLRHTRLSILHLLDFTLCSGQEQAQRYKVTGLLTMAILFGSIQDILLCKNKSAAWAELSAIVNEQSATLNNLNTLLY